MIKPIITSVVLFFVLLTSSYSYLGTVVLVKGTINDASMNAPIGTKINFISADGKKTSCQSNSKDGTYQQVLNSGETYQVVIEDFILVEGDRDLVVPKVAEYTEIVKNYKGKKIETGLELYNLQGFLPNSQKMTDVASHELSDLKDFLKINTKVHLKITVSSADSYFKPLKKKIEILPEKKGGKKKTATVTVSTHDQLNDLLTSRIDAVRNFLTANGIRETRVEFSKDLVETAKPAPKKKGKQDSPAHTRNLKIEVGRMLKL